MDHDPQTHRESESKPDQISRCLVNGRKTFALRTADAHCHDHERPDEECSKNHGQESEPHRGGGSRRSCTGLLRFGRHGFAFARKKAPTEPRLKVSPSRGKPIAYGPDLECALSPLPSPGALVPVQNARWIPELAQSLAAIVAALGCVYRSSILGSLWPLMAATSGMFYRLVTQIMEPQPGDPSSSP